MTNTTEEMRIELISLFSRFDRDANGYVDEREFAEIVHALGEYTNAEDLSKQFIAADINDDGLIQFDEFVAWWLSYK